ncbi:hypothetical protein VQ02_01255 [Methylobacterium variabile]|uniref:Uncharacterized protein n=1 Tax=Methylobacterium variabile TaxID=298794 RepID=A0A0J6TAW9_9HYPH|nr:hypothetical protein [Methylobacterium variabile]KMO42994.1 hypothetical protein VQ02_01255 [Methylobacterium variabile]
MDDNGLAWAVALGKPQGPAVSWAIYEELSAWLGIDPAGRNAGEALRRPFEVTEPGAWPAALAVVRVEGITRALVGEATAWRVDAVSALGERITSAWNGELPGLVAHFSLGTGPVLVLAERAGVDLLLGAVKEAVRDFQALTPTSRSPG